MKLTGIDMPLPEANDFIDAQDPESVIRLSRDLAQASRLLTPNEARFLVDAYYQIQGWRLTSANQKRSLDESQEPTAVLEWLLQQSHTLEKQVQRALDQYSNSQPIGQWSRSITGIGPVLSAGLLAHIDITKAKTAGAIWKFAGLDPTVVWEKGKKRPYNATLKVICWRVGDSFVKQSNRDSDFYGHLYRQRKEQEVRRNDQLLFKDQAALTLQIKKIKDAATRETYESGKLPLGRLELRARRWAVKLFLSHFHDVGYRLTFDTPPPNPYAIAHLQHTHYIPPPNVEVVGLTPWW